VDSRPTLSCRCPPANEAALLQPLRHHPNPGAVPIEHLEPVASLLVNTNTAPERGFSCSFNSACAHSPLNCCACPPVHRQEDPQRRGKRQHRLSSARRAPGPRPPPRWRPRIVRPFGKVTSRPAGPRPASKHSSWKLSGFPPRALRPTVPSQPGHKGAIRNAFPPRERLLRQPALLIGAISAARRVPSMIWRPRSSRLSRVSTNSVVPVSIPPDYHAALLRDRRSPPGRLPSSGGRTSLARRSHPAPTDCFLSQKAKAARSPAARHISQSATDGHDHQHQGQPVAPAQEFPLDLRIGWARRSDEACSRPQLSRNHPVAGASY